jgi:hypothetical protein
MPASDLLIIYECAAQCLRFEALSYTKWTQAGNGSHVQLLRANQPILNETSGCLDWSLGKVTGNNVLQ